MGRDLRACVKSCETCQMWNTPLHTPSSGIVPTPPLHCLLEMVGIDHLGPFPTSDVGNGYVIVVVDSLAKWVEAQPVSGTCAFHLVCLIQSNIVLHYSMPHTILMDQGTLFKSCELASFLNNVSVGHAFTSLYQPQCNGFVERTNCIFLCTLYAYVNDAHSDWDKQVPYGSCTINISRQDTTNEVQFRMVYEQTAILAEDVPLDVTWSVQRK